MSRRLLVALNDSEHAWNALEHTLMFFPDSDITVLNVVDPAGAGYGQRSNGQSSEEPAAANSHQNLFEEATELANEHRTTIETRMEEGQPAQTIVDFAVDHKVDQIVVGSQSRSGVSRILLGSVAETVAQQSPISVTIIK